MRISYYILQVLATVFSVGANVEKVVFLGPKQTFDCSYHSGVDASQRDVLTPNSPSIRREIIATFPSSSNSWKGSDHWIILDDLEPRRRYEVRLCWSAIQPTDFSLSLHHPNEAFGSAELNSSFFSQQIPKEIQPHSLAALENREQPENQCSKWSGVFLHLFAAADYLTTHESLMSEVPPVKVEIILDPFFLNILPRSLLPTAVYLVILAAVSFIISTFVWKGIRYLAQSTSDFSRDKTKKNE